MSERREIWAIGGFETALPLTASETEFAGSRKFREVLPGDMELTDERDMLRKQLAVKRHQLRNAIERDSLRDCVDEQKRIIRKKNCDIEAMRVIENTELKELKERHNKLVEAVKEVLDTCDHEHPVLRALIESEPCPKCFHCHLHYCDEPCVSCGCTYGESEVSDGD